MDGSGKDREGSRDLMRGRSTASRSSPATRQRPMVSFSQTVSNGNGDCTGGDGDGDGVDVNLPMVKWKEKVRTSKWKSRNKHASDEAGGSRLEGEDASPLQETLSTSATCLTSRKTVKVQGKVVEDSDAVDPIPVPRKLRSAINKRNSQSSFPTMTNAKKKQRHTPNGLHMLSGNDGRRCKPSMLLRAFTKDEEEVVEALCELSRMLPIPEQIPRKEVRRASEADQDNSAACLEGENKNLLQQSMACETKSPSSCLEKPLEETIKDGDPHPKQFIAGCQKDIDPDLNISPKPSSCATPENKLLENSSANLKFSSSLGVMQPIHHDIVANLPLCKSDLPLSNGCVGSVLLKHEVRQAKHNCQSTPKSVYVEGMIPPHIQPSNNSVPWPGPVTKTARLTSAGVNLQSDKVSLDISATWKKCAIHIFICHRIKNNQVKEEQTLFLAHDSKLNGTKLCAPPNNATVGLQSGLNGTPLKRNKQEGRNKILYNARIITAHQSPGFLEAKQKQACDLLSLSAGIDSSNSANGVKSPGQLHSAFLHAQVPRHALVPFPFPHVPYAPSLASQQVQLQVPHFIGNRYYGPQMDNTISNIQLQQQYHQPQLWQAHMAAQHRAIPACVGVSQSERPQDPSAAMCQSAPISSAPSQGGSYCPTILRHHHQLPNASSPSSSKGMTTQNQQLGSLH